MAIIYLEDHTFCNSYGENKAPIIEELQLERGKQIEFSSNNNKVLFVMSGGLDFWEGETPNRKISKKEMVMLSSNRKFTAIVNESSTVLIIKFPHNIQLWDCISMESIINKKEINDENEIRHLEVNEVLWNYASSLKYYLSEGLSCLHFFELKLKEFFFIMKSFYSKETLASFFYPIFSNDIDFSHFIYRNYDKVKTAQELATLSNYSFSGFQKRFKRVFRVSVYHWMLQKKSQRILQDINLGVKPLKEISEEYGFNSPAHFNDFCKIHFGCTPGKMRKKSYQGEPIVNAFGHNLEKIG